MLVKGASCLAKIKEPCLVSKRSPAMPGYGRALSLHSTAAISFYICSILGGRQSEPPQGWSAFAHEGHSAARLRD